MRAIVLGSSAGGLQALQAALGPLPATFPAPLIAVQHLHRDDHGRFAAHLDESLELAVVEAVDKLPLRAGRLHVAPANYHLLVERDQSLALSVDPKVNWTRPSIDVLFESAARVFGAELVAVVLSGANRDGAQGLRQVTTRGGRGLVQDPATAANPVMPQAALDHGCVDAEDVLPAQLIGGRLLALADQKERS
jgi:two-component system chemotaxis response regulator CheB